MEKEIKFCQSCGMSLTTDELLFVTFSPRLHYNSKTFRTFAASIGRNKETT